MKFRASTFALLALNVALAGVGAVQLWSGSHVGRISSTAPRAVSMPTVMLESAPPLVDLASVTSQAVFHESRVFVVPADPTQTIQAPPDYRLSGSMTLPGQSPVAILIHNTTGSRIRVAADADVEGWKVAEITSRQVVLSLGDRTIQVTSTSRANSSVPTADPALRGTSGFGMRAVGAAGVPSPESGSRRVLTGTPRATTRTPVQTEGARLYRPPPSQ